MSTRVNISVKDQALIDRAKDLQNASRARLITKNQEKKNEEKATQKIDKALGVDATTASFGGVRASSYLDTRPAKERIPAATGRPPVTNVLLPPVAPFEEASPWPGDTTTKYYLLQDLKQRSTSGSDVSLKTNRLYFEFTGYSLYSNSSPQPIVDNTAESYFIEGGGPNGANSMRITITSPWGGGYYPYVSGCGQVNNSPPDDPSIPYTAVTITNDLLTEAYGGPSTYTRYAWYCYDGPQIEQAWQMGEKAGNTGDFWANNIQDFSGDRYAFYETNSFNMEMYVKIDGITSTVFSLDAGDITLEIGNEMFSEDEISRVIIGSYYSGDSFPVDIYTNQLTEWTHIAMSLKNGQLLIFMNGTLLHTFSASEPLDIVPDYISYNHLFVDIQYYPEAPEHYTDTLSSVNVSGLRFEKKARYSSNFTPPSRIK